MIVEERAPGLPLPSPAHVRERRARSVLEVVLVVLPFVALSELVLIRTFYRVGIFVPRTGTLRTVYAVLTALGSFALNLSTVLGFIALGLLAVRAVRRERPVAGLALGAFGVGALVALLPGAAPAGPAVRLAFVLAVALVVWPFVRQRGPVAGRLAVGAAGVAALLSSYAGLASDAARLFPSAHGPSGAVAAQLAGEAVILLAGFLVFAAWVRERGLRAGPILLGALPASLLAVAWVANATIAGILVLWTAGLRLYLPIWLYVLALWAFSGAAAGWVRDGTGRAGGLVLLVAAGFLLDSTYAQLLVILALVMLTGGIGVGGLRSGASRTAD